ncbi:MAG: hypothetical protein WEC75_03900 [Dehalococcoidia bacterium]
MNRAEAPAVSHSRRGDDRRTASRLVVAPWRSVGRLLLAVAVIAIAGGALAAFVLWPRGPRDDGVLRAVIVDQLGQTDPNPEFIDRNVTRLREAGYAVDYVPAEQVTVEYYRTLPTRDYDLVVLRSHSAWLVRRKDEETGEAATDRQVTLFTNELYSDDDYTDDQLQHRISRTFYPWDETGPRYFGIEPGFVEDSMQGRFRGTTVVLMGCAGLSSTGMADAFLARGASAFISWDDEVTAYHTDAATERLLEHLLSPKDIPAREAVVRTMEDVGEDPAFGARLFLYP